MKILNRVAVTLCLALLAMPASQSPAAAEAADAFDCTACHPMKIRDFKGRRANPVTPVEEFPDLPTGRQDVASSPAMCFSCHDGFVMDSRRVWNGGFHGHPLGVAPPGDMRIPELGGSSEFPLNQDGKVYCGTCHSAHASEADGAWDKVEPFMRQSADGGRICTGCHADKLAIEGSGHDKGGRRNKDFESRGTCGYCHAPHGSDRPVMWGRELGHATLDINRTCRSCHEDGPEPGEHPPLVMAWSQAVRDSIFPGTPGEMPVFSDAGSQSLVGHIGCGTCHDVHRERAPGRPEHLEGLHLRLPEFVEPLCADCHGEQSLFLYKFFHSRASR